MHPTNHMRHSLLAPPTTEFTHADPDHTALVLREDLNVRSEQPRCHGVA